MENIWKPESWIWIDWLWDSFDGHNLFPSFSNWSAHEVDPAHGRASTPCAAEVCG